jgi:predicted MPP superfamily phosphohydrolase
VPVHVRTLARAALAVTAVGAAGVGYAALEAQAFTVRRFTLPVLPSGSPTLRLLHVSDIHLVPRQRRKAAWIHRLAELEPDLVVSTGDNIAAENAVPAALEAQGQLLRRPGAFVLGSNDYFGPKPKSPARYLLPVAGRRPIHGSTLPTDDLVKGFRAAGWLDLTNRRGIITVRGVRLDLVGVDDPHLRRDRYVAVSRPHDPEAGLTIGVAHAPYRRVLQAMAADGVQLLLAGHTHGGQLCLPGLGTLVTNCDLPRSHARGVSRWPSCAGPDAWLHVSAGVGTSPYTPVRFACRPEASLLTLVPRRSS